MNLKQLIVVGQEVKDFFGKKGTITDVSQSGFVVDFKDKKDDFNIDAFTRGYLSFVNEKYQKVVEEEKKKRIERNNKEEKSEVLVKVKKSNHYKNDRMRNYLDNELNIDVHFDFENSLKERRIERGCIIDKTNTKFIYDDLCSPFGFEKAAYTSPQGQSLYAKNASENISVWFIKYNNIYYGLKNKDSEKWTNSILERSIKEEWNFNSATNKRKLYDMYCEECEDHEKLRAVFARVTDKFYVFLGIYKITKCDDPKNIDYENDNATTYYELYSNTLVQNYVLN